MTTIKRAATLVAVTAAVTLALDRLLGLHRWGRRSRRTSTPTARSPPARSRGCSHVRPTVA